MDQVGEAEEGETMRKVALGPQGTVEIVYSPLSPLARKRGDEIYIPLS